LKEAGLLIADKHDECGSGPVLLEDHGKGWRAICCACWMHGPMKLDRKAAIKAWSDKSTHEEWYRAYLARREAPTR
jgi:hypothetical protein